MMKPQYTRKLALTLAIITLVLSLVNLAFNFFLKNQLPELIKENSHYNISYKTLDVELATGNIKGSGLKISSKNPNNLEAIRLEGSAEGLQVSGLGILRLLRSGELLASDLILENPNLEMRLARPVDKKTGKKRAPMPFRNIQIKGGNILVKKHTDSLLTSVQDLDLEVKNLKLSEQGIETMLPVVFDKYSIAGKNFVFRTDDLYQIEANQLTTEEGKMTIEGFKLVPIISFDEFLKKHPKKKNYIQFQAKELAFTDILLKKNKLSLSQAELLNPEITLRSSGKSSEKKQKPFKYILNLEDFQLKNAKIHLYHPNGSDHFVAGDLNLDAQKILMNEKTSLSSIPFTYGGFKMNGKDLKYFLKGSVVALAQLSVDPTLVKANEIHFTPSSNGGVKKGIEGKIQSIALQIQDWAFTEGLLDFNASSLKAMGANLKVHSTSSKTKAPKKPLKGIKFPLTIQDVSLTNSNIEIAGKKGTQNLKNLRFEGKNLRITQESSKNAVPFTLEDYTLSSTNYQSTLNEFYQLAVGKIVVKKNQLSLQGFSLYPLLSRSQFIRRIPTEKDLYTVKAKEISLSGPMDLLSDKRYIDANNLLITGLDAQIFRSKTPPDDLTRKPMYSELLRSIKMPLRIKTVKIANSSLTYEEDTPKSNGPGKLTFTNFNLDLKNLNSGKSAPYEIPIQIQTRFMGVSPMIVNWTLNTASMSDRFKIAGHLSDLPATHINAFVEPYLKVRTTGYIEDLAFNFTGNRSVLSGTLNMKHKDLKVEILKPTGETNKILSAAANIIVKTNSAEYPPSVVVDQIERDPTKSFFNFFWKGLELGLKKTLIGNNVEKTEETAKNTVETTKKTVEEIKSDLSGAKEQIKEKVSTTKESLDTKKKKSPLKNLFKRKKQQDTP